MTVTPELTAARVQQRVARKMGWARVEDWPSELEPTACWNEVGEWLCGFEWSWLMRPPVNLSLVAGQSYLSGLPDDFARVYSLQSTLAGGYSITVAEDLQAVIDAQSVGLGRSASYVACPVFSGPTILGPKPAVRLEIGPVPSISATDVFILGYFAGWVPVTQASDHILVPSWMVPLYLLACCAYVEGLEHDAVASSNERLDALEASTVFRSAMERDSTMQPDLGRPRNTVAEMLSEDDEPWLRRHTGPIPIITSG